MKRPTIQDIAIGLAVGTSLGIVLHDTHLDEATSLAIALPVAFIGMEISSAIQLSGADHTHEERVSLSQAIRDLHKGAPRVQPREEHRRYVVRRNMGKAGHQHGDYILPFDVL